MMNRRIISVDTYVTSIQEMTFVIHHKKISMPLPAAIVV